MALNITKEKFDELCTSGKPFVIDFWAEWCGPCRAIGPIIEELAGEYAGKVEIGKCNVDEVNELSVKFGIRSIPTVIFLKPGGELADKIVGSAGKDAYQNKIEALLS